MCKDKKPTAIEFRQRIVREDDLLHSRTTLFLVTNSLLLNAIRLSSDTHLIELLVSCLGILVTLVWCTCSRQNWKVIEHLTKKYREAYKEDIIEDIVQNAMSKPGWKRPVELIAKLLPCTFIVSAR